LTTERLYLREITVEDVDRIYEIYADEEVTKYIERLYDNPDKEKEFTSEYINNMYKFYEYGIWVVCLKENDKIIGRAGLSNREVDGVNRLELGYVIGVPYQKKGYAFEVCCEICRYAKAVLCEDEIVCFIEKGNYPSIKLAKKLGFEYEQDVITRENMTEKILEYYVKDL
jgi:RimJ/RimL family protein N-acetyltransferase